MARISVQKGCKRAQIVIGMIMIAKIAIGVHSFALVECVRIIVVVATLDHTCIGIHSNRIFTSLDVKAAICDGRTATLVTAIHSITKWILVDIAALI